ncbi:MAG: phosphotransferase family protein, partial [Propionibacteriales bacterium]|nr:phosphotransferase family protein [Propionibacteriales bacterium]
FYEGFAHFKFAVITQGVAARVTMGAMAGQDFGNLDHDVVRLAEDGLTKLEQGG